MPVGDTGVVVEMASGCVGPMVGVTAGVSNSQTKRRSDALGTSHVAKAMSVAITPLFYDRIPAILTLLYFQ